MHSPPVCSFIPVLQLIVRSVRFASDASKQTRQQTNVVILFRGTANTLQRYINSIAMSKQPKKTNDFPKQINSDAHYNVCFDIMT